MLSNAYQIFRNQYQRQHWYDPEEIPYLFHTTRIENVGLILEQGLLSNHDAKGIPNRRDIGGRDLGPAGCQYFARMFHSPYTPFHYNRFVNVGGDNLAMLIVTADVLDDENVSIVGMSSHGLAYHNQLYFDCCLLNKGTDNAATELCNYYKTTYSESDSFMRDFKSTQYPHIPMDKFSIFDNQPEAFFKSLTARFNLLAKGNNWSRGEVLFSNRDSYPGNGAGEWGNIRAAEVLIFPNILPKYIRGIACTDVGKSKLSNLPSGIIFFKLNAQGCY